MTWNGDVWMRIYLFIGKGIPSNQISVQGNSITSEVRLLTLKGKIMKILLILLLFCTAAGAQTKDELRRKYGEPFSEIFLVRSGVTVTATYEPNAHIKELLIAPQLPSELIKSKPATLSYDTLREIIDELIPRKERGENLMSSFLNITCLPQNDCAGSSEEYEKLTIYYNAGKDGANYAVIQWKK
jgi:hypothetical protein